MKAMVDQSKCIGCGNCVALTDRSVFDFNDDNLATCVLDTIPEELVEVTKDAINQCPTEAISEEK